MAQRNGHSGLRLDDRARYGQISQPAARQFSQNEQQFGLLAEGIGPLQVSGLVEQSPKFVQQVAPPRGMMDGFVKTCQRWGLNEQQQLILLGYGDNTFFGSQFLSGQLLSPPQDVRDRVGYIVGISVGLGAIFDEVLEAEVAWLNAAQPKLRGKAPLALMLGGRMSYLMTVANLVAEERALV